MSIIRDALIRAGVSNLKEFGYPDVDAKNILEDEIYRAFFASMLRDNLGQSGTKIDNEINDLLAIVSEPSA